MNKGQVMLLTVLIVSGTILGATAIAGVLMLNQIRQATNVTQSLQAIFAADTGLEWQLYTTLKDPTYPQPKMDNADFVAETVLSEKEMEFRSVGCAGALRPEAGGGCPRPINRSLQLFFELVL